MNAQEWSRYVCEDLKERHWRRLEDTSLPIEDRCAALLICIMAHWTRSHAGAERHPDFATFAAHWIWANGLHVKEQDVVEALKRSIPMPRRPRIATGRSYWGTR